MHLPFGMTTCSPFITTINVILFFWSQAHILHPPHLMKHCAFPQLWGTGKVITQILKISCSKQVRCSYLSRMSAEFFVGVVEIFWECKGISISFSGILFWIHDIKSFDCISKHVGTPSKCKDRPLAKGWKDTVEKAHWTVSQQPLPVLPDSKKRRKNKDQIN